MRLSDLQGDELDRERATFGSMPIRVSVNRKVRDAFSTSIIVAFL